MPDETSKPEKRAYRKRRRAESERETRQRITEAAVALHGSLGPARTTVSGVAERANVQRATVYRHFPDDESLFAACSAHWAAQNPLPDMATWAEVPDPVERLRLALDDLYAYYGRNEAMLENVIRDAPLVPAMQAPAEEFGRFFEAAAEVLQMGRPDRGLGRKRVRAAIGLAIQFATWRSLVREHRLGKANAVHLMVALVEAAGKAKS